MQLILVRHPQSDYNAEGNRYCGRTDSPLSAQGLLQVERLEAHFRQLPVDAVWSSPLTRAFTCAQRIADIYGLRVHVSDAFIEYDFGKWEGMRSSEIKEEYPLEWQRWGVGHPFGGPPGGERPIDVYARAIRGLEELCTLHEQDSRVVLVAHDQVIRMLFTFFLNIPYYRWRQLDQPKNGSLCEVRWNPSRGTWHMGAYSKVV